MTPVKKVEGHKEIVLQKKGSQQDGEELASENFKLQSVGMTHEQSPLTRTNIPSKNNLASQGSQVDCASIDRTTDKEAAHSEVRLAGIGN